MQFFDIRGFKKWPESAVFCTFWLENVLLATAACNFYGSELQKSCPHWGFLYILTWKCASRHSPVPFFVSQLNSNLRTRHFSEHTFSNIRKHESLKKQWFATVIRDIPNISRTCSLRVRWSSFYWLYTRVDLVATDFTSLLCFSALLPSHVYSAFQLCILSEVSKTSKLPSIISAHIVPVLQNIINRSTISS